MSELRTHGESHVSIILPYLNDYRVPLLKALEAKLSHAGIALEVATGTPEGIDVARGDAASGYPTRQLEKTGIRTPKGLVYMRKLDRQIRTADLVIVEHAVKNLDSHALLFRPRTKKVAIWGHGKTITKAQSTFENLTQRAMIARADWYFGYTAGSVDRAVDMGMPASRCTNVQNTVDTARLRELRRDHPRRDRAEWQALYVGGLDKSKRLEFLFDACRKVYAEDPRFRLLIVGNGEDRALVEATAAREEWCIYKGSFPLAENFSAVRDCKIILMPGRVGLAAVDSFAMESPIITTQWDYHAPEFEYLKEDNSIVSANRGDNFSRHILELMASPSALERLQLGCSSAASRLSIEDMSTRFATGIISALGTKRRTIR
ncbi:glycosyltransferase family 4 protein [Rhodococcus pyridinivorans]|uniref:glycosyltransferase family 4 protein n=1 Tax=Rhodococcus pyridinivorans TaxID=103816 RepID=UPI003D7F5F18